MTRLFERKTFEGLRDRGSGRTYEDIDLRRCDFQGCFTICGKPKERITFRRVNLVDCEERGCTLRGAIVDECVINGLETGGLMQTWATVFKHVTFKGQVGRIMVSGMIGTSERATKDQAAFDEANTDFYSGVDWAIDIREAEFEEADLRGVPARLVRRDPETQIVVSRQLALGGAWRKLDLSDTHWATAIELFLQRGQSDVVFVAPKRAREFQKLVRGLRLLREAGIAEPG
jgi:hypothetical protein